MEHVDCVIEILLQYVLAEKHSPVIITFVTSMVSRIGGNSWEFRERGTAVKSQNQATRYRNSHKWKDV